MVIIQLAALLWWLQRRFIPDQMAVHIAVQHVIVGKFIRIYVGVGAGDHSVDRQLLSEATESLTTNPIIVPVQMWVSVRPTHLVVTI
ncbi:MAG: hypothetical protein Q7L19_10405 [Pseudohongiella sp.]|nr:hypothetical protein [Pseudohongiella sp.]